MELILTEDFETGFIDGHVWRGLDGLRDFLSQRDGFFDESHVIDQLLESQASENEVEAHTRLHFFLRRWEAPAPVSEDSLASAFTPGGSAWSTAGGASPPRWWSDSRS